MAYPQQFASKYQANGFKYWRLNTLLASAGDIYESDESGLGFVIGPDSDIANVGISYFDEQQPNFMGQFNVTQKRSFVGLVPANVNDGTYPPSNRPARILIYPQNRWNPDFWPGSEGFTRGQDQQILVTPRLDVLQYFQNEPSGIVPTRNDKEWFFSELVTPSIAQRYLCVTLPYYGRRYAKIEFMNPSTDTTFDLQLFGVDLRQQIADGSSDPGDTGNFTPLITRTDFDHVNFSLQIIVDSGKTLTGAFDADAVYTGGMFDMLMFCARTTPPTVDGQTFALKVIMSDEPGGQ
jgi:hypothetical protein